MRRVLGPVRQLLRRSGTALLRVVGAVLRSCVRGPWALASWVKRSRARVHTTANQATPNEPTRYHGRSMFASIVRWFFGLLIVFALGFYTNVRFAEWQAAREQSAVLQQLGHIAYVRKGDIWLCRADGSHHRLLVAAPQCRGLAWSPDGAQLAFVRSMGTGEESTVALYVADLEAGELLKCTDDIPGTATWSDIVCAGRWGTLTAIAFDYEQIHKSAVYAPCLARVSMGEYHVKRGRILPRCYCPGLDATGELYAIRNDTDPWRTSIIGGGDGYYLDARDEIIASDQTEELDGGYGICTIVLSPRADEIVFRVGRTGAGQLWTVEVDLGFAVGAPKKLCDLENIVEIGWHPWGTHLLLRQESHASYHAALPSTEGLILLERATGLFRQLLTKPRDGYWHFSRQCWSEDGQWLLLTRAQYEQTEEGWTILEPMFLNVQTNERISLSLPLVDDPRLHLQPTATSIPGKAQWRFDSSGLLSEGKRVSDGEELSEGN